MLSICTLSMTSKHRNTASHLMYPSISTLPSSRAPEVSHISAATGRPPTRRSTLYDSYVVGAMALDFLSCSLHVSLFLFYLARCEDEIGGRKGTRTSGKEPYRARLRRKKTVSTLYP